MRITFLASIAFVLMLVLVAQSWWALALGIPIVFISLGLHAAAAAPPKKATPRTVLGLIANLVICAGFIVMGVKSHFYLKAQGKQGEWWFDAFTTPLGAAVFLGACLLLGFIAAWSARRGRKAGNQ